MGRITNSLKNQIGKDTGKLISNYLFRDRHSTPYRRVSSNNEANNIKSNNRREFEEHRMRINEENIKKNDLYTLDRAVIEAVDKVIDTPIPVGERDVLKLISDLEIQLEANFWYDVTGKKKDEARIRNKYPDAVLKKYEQCITELQFSGTNPERLKHLSIELSKYRKKRNKSRTKSRNQLILASIILIVFLVAVFSFG